MNHSIVDLYDHLNFSIKVADCTKCSIVNIETGMAKEILEALGNQIRLLEYGDQDTMQNGLMPAT